MGLTNPDKDSFISYPKSISPLSPGRCHMSSPKAVRFVSDCGSESYRIAEFIDYYINLLLQKHPSYMQDMYTFVHSLKTLIVPANSFFFTIGVDSLYTNIDTVLGLQALTDMFQRFPDASRPDRDILKLLEITLTKNDFEFNGRHYLLACNCAIGQEILSLLYSLILTNIDTA